MSHDIDPAIAVILANSLFSRCDRVAIPLGDLFRRRAMHYRYVNLPVAQLWKPGAPRAFARYLHILQCQAAFKPSKHSLYIQIGVGANLANLSTSSVYNVST